MADPTQMMPGDAAQPAEPTIPMIAPDGKSVADIPHSRAQDAVKGGYKLAVDMSAPDGKTATIPMDKIHDAMTKGNYKLPGATDAHAKNVDYIGNLPVLNEQGTGAVAGVTRAARSISSSGSALYHDVTDAPRNEEEQNILSSGTPSKTNPFGYEGGTVLSKAALAGKRLILDQAVAAYQQGRKFEDMAEKEENPVRKKALMDAAGAYKDSAHVPLFGPVAVRPMERAAYGDLSDPNNPGIPWGEKGSQADMSGGMAELLTYAEAPEIAGKGVGLAAKIPGAVADLTSKGVKAGTDSLKAGVQSTAEAATKSVANATAATAKAVTKNVAIPAAKGVISGITDSIVDSVTNKTGDLTSRVSAALDNAGEAGAALKPQAKAIADSIKAKVSEGTNSMVDTVKEIVNEHYNFVSDVMSNNSGVIDSIGKGAKSAVDTVKDMANEYHTAFDDITGNISGMFNKAVDAYKASTTPEQAAGSLRDLRSNIREQLSNAGYSREAIAEISDRVDEEFVKSHSVGGGSQGADSAGWIKDTLNSVAQKYNKVKSTLADMAGDAPKTPIANLGAKYDWAQPLMKAADRSMKEGGARQTIERLVREMSPYGRKFVEQVDQPVDKGFRESLGAASIDARISPNGQALLQDIASNARRTGKVNIDGMISQLEDSLAQPGKFKYFEGGNVALQKGGIENPAMTAHTYEVMHDLLDTAKQLRDVRNHTTRFGSNLQAVLTPIGFTGAGAAIGSYFGMPGALGGAVMGLLTHYGITKLIDANLLSPAEAGFFSKMMSKVPTNPPPITAEYLQYADRAKKAGIDLKDSPEFQHLPSFKQKELIEMDEHAKPILEKVKTLLRKGADAYSNVPSHPTVAPSQPDGGGNSKQSMSRGLKGLQNSGEQDV